VTFNFHRFHINKMKAERRECTCEKCASLCKGNPGWFSPGQARGAAQFLGLSLLDFFKKYLIVEHWNNARGFTWVLTPQKDYQEGQLVASYKDAHQRGPCRLLTERGCMLPTLHRPLECACHWSCTPREEPNPYARGNIKEAWVEETSELEELFGPMFQRVLGEM